MFEQFPSARCICGVAVGTALLLIGAAALVREASAQQGRTVAILMPGAGGVHPNDFLIRNRSKIGGAGIETRVTTSPSEAAEIARSERQKGRKVVLVGMSLGTLHVAQALAAGAPANGVVLVSGVLREVASTVGSPGKLPPTLIVHHRNDACIKTPPSGVGYFQQWSGGRARVSWIATTGGPDDQPCRPNGAHGFFRKDGQPVAVIVSFIRSR
jgi:pimeloyl-ACP methyl ester carboxylesterase